jgi:hypothetical protein
MDFWCACTSHYANNSHDENAPFVNQAAWESSGWIHQIDPRGWTQWYFRFFNGRRIADTSSTITYDNDGEMDEGGEDMRQMKRWRGVCGDKGRWKTNLLNKIVRAHADVDDAKISPVSRQTLLHGGYESNDVDLEKQRKKLKGK